MGEAKDAAYYDRGYGNNPRYRLDPDHAPWAQLWYWVLGRTGEEMIADVGCGPGHLAELLQRRGHPPHQYVGFDFSTEALAQARERAPGYRFVEAVFPADKRRVLQYPEATVVACEFFEHVEKELPLIKALRPGARVLATVPRKDSASHVRHFETMAEVARRYERWLELRSIERIGNAYAFEGLRRGRT